MDYSDHYGTGIHRPAASSAFVHRTDGKDEENWPEETTVKEQDFSLAETKENCDWKTKKKTIICKSCGAESIYDENQIVQNDDFGIYYTYICSILDRILLHLFVHVF